jgi:hypothetical protein
MHRIVYEDFGQSINLLHHSVNLAVFRTTDRDIGQGPSEEVARRSQGLQQPVSDLRVHDAVESSQVIVMHGKQALLFSVCSMPVG